MNHAVYLPSIDGGGPSACLSAIKEINLYRQCHNVPAVTLHSGLMASSYLYAAHMRDCTAFGHAPDWLARILPHYPGWKTLAELLAAGYPNAASAIEALYHSPSHGAAMISTLYDEVGVGYAIGGNRYGHWWCVHLGSRKKE